ncbi:MAG: hypothetical protein ACRD8O_14580 [Bryobacteraceae bacterium]
MSAAMLVVPALAQTGNIRSIVRYRVKPDRAADFQSAAKEFTGVLKSANYDKGGTWWVALTGPAEYVLVRHHAKWAELDVTRDPKLKEYGADLTRISARMQQCTESVERIVDEVQPDLSLPRSTEVPKMVRTLLTRVRPDKVDEYMALIKSEVLPAMKKSGAKNYVVAQTRYGAAGAEFSSSTGINSWSDLDGASPLVQAMGEARYQQFLAKLRPLVRETERNVYRHLPELSYLPVAATTTSSGRR